MPDPASQQTDPSVQLTADATWRFRAVQDDRPGPWQVDPAAVVAPFGGRWAPMPWPTTWQVYGPIDSPDRDAEPGLVSPVHPTPSPSLRIGSTAYPSQLVSADSLGVVDLAATLGLKKRAVAWAVAVLFLDQPERITIHAGADWWQRWLIDGREVYRTQPGGNLHRVNDRAHPFQVALDAGRHTLAVRIEAGSGGWAFASEAVRMIEAPTDPRTVQVEACCTFTVDDPQRYVSLTLVGHPCTQLNDQALTPPWEGMRFRSLHGIASSLLRAGDNTLTRQWTVEPADVPACAGPLQVFQASGRGERLRAAEHLWGVPAAAARILTGPLQTLHQSRGRIITCRTDARVAVELQLADGTTTLSEPGLLHAFDLSDHTLETPQPFTLKPATAPSSATCRGELRPVHASRTCRIALAADAGPLPEMWRTVAAAMQTCQPDLVVFVGDMVSHGRNEWEWHEQFVEPAAALLATTPMCPVPGNHDENAPLMHGLWPTFNHGRHWSLAFGPALLVGLDGAAAWKEGGDDVRWLDALLAADRSPFVFVFNHYPACSSGVHTRRNAAGQLAEATVHASRNIILPLLQQHRVTAMFSGHDHGYERFELDESSPSLVIIAGAGAYLYDEHAHDDPHAANRACRASVHHYATLDLSPHQARLQARTPAGQSLDDHTWHPRVPADASA